MSKTPHNVLPMPISEILNEIAAQYNPGTEDAAILDRASKGKLNATG